MLVLIDIISILSIYN